MTSAAPSRLLSLVLCRLPGGRSRGGSRPHSWPLWTNSVTSARRPRARRPSKGWRQSRRLCATVLYVAVSCHSASGPACSSEEGTKMKRPELREGLPQDVGMDDVRIGRLRELVGGWVERGDNPSVIVLVARRGVVVLHEAFGVRRHGDPTPTLKPDSIFPLTSCSKPLTAAAVMCLVDDSLIRLNPPFIDYIPALDVPEVEWLAEARVADLLCPPSGIDRLLLGEFIDAA